MGAPEVYGIPASVPLWAVILSPAARIHRRAGARPPPPKERERVDRQKVKKEIRGWVLTIAAVLAFRTFLYEAVYIPSGSMIPTLQIGDYVIVEKWAYGARLPFTSTAQATWRMPAKGDIVVLLAPPGNPREIGRAHV